MADAPRILIVTSRYYAHISAELEAGVVEGLEKVGATYEFLEVPGAFEIPAAIAMAAGTGEWDGFVALGCVIRGETGHYDIVAGESARALMDLAVARGLPLGNGILTVDTEAQALARARVAEMNKGGGAAEAALAVLAIKRSLMGFAS
jgi:6,7-dimethyl-8-ribityllumazine synthase